MNTQLHEYVATKNHQHRVQEANRKAAQHLAERDYAPIKTAFPSRAIALATVVLLSAVLVMVVL